MGTTPLPFHRQSRDGRRTNQSLLELLIRPTVCRPLTDPSSLSITHTGRRLVLARIQDGAVQHTSSTHYIIVGSSSWLSIGRDVSRTGNTVPRNAVTSAEIDYRVARPAEVVSVMRRSRFCQFRSTKHMSYSSCSLLCLLYINCIIRHAVNAKSAT